MSVRVKAKSNTDSVKRSCSTRKDGKAGRAKPGLGCVNPHAGKKQGYLQGVLLEVVKDGGELRVGVLSDAVELLKSGVQGHELDRLTTTTSV